MDATQAMSVLETLGTASDESESLLRHFAELLDGAAGRLNEDSDGEEGYTLDDGEAAAIFAALEWLRREADKRERDLVRHMKYHEGMTWQAIADAVDSQLGGRQAAQKRWARQVSPYRRTTTGDRRRGNAETRRVVDTTTETA